MKQEETEKLARKWFVDNGIGFDDARVAKLARFIGEIENAALKQADAEIAKWEVRAHIRLHAGEMTAQEMRSILAVVSAIRASVHRALITPAKTADTEG